MAELVEKDGKLVVVGEENLNFTIPNPNGTGDVAYTYGPEDEVPRDQAEAAGLLKGKKAAASEEKEESKSSTDVSDEDTDEARTAKRPSPRGR